MTDAFAWLLGLGALVALWQWSAAARERVDRVSREVCEELALQRLDEAVSLRALRLRRVGRGIVLERLFGFEFSATGADRRRGEVCLRGERPLWVHLDHPDGPMHLPLDRSHLRVVD